MSVLTKEQSEALQHIVSAANSLDRLTAIAVAAGNWAEARKACLRRPTADAYDRLASAEAKLVAEVDR